MKKSLLLITIIAFLFSGCKDNDDATLSYKGNVDSDYIEALVQGRESACFNCKERHLFKKDSSTNDEWQEISLYEYVGYSFSLKRLQILDGCVWEEVSLFNPSFGPSRLYIPWLIYCRLTKYKKDIYVANKLEYNKDEHTLKYGNVLCVVERAEGELLNLSSVSSYVSGATNEVGLDREIVLYRKAELDLPRRDDMEVFSSALEAKLGMIAMMREVFGDELRVADYQNRFAEKLGNDVINFDELAENLRKGLAF